MPYQPTFSSALTEISVCIVFAVACLNARGQGGRWLSTVIWGGIAGFVAECLIIRAPIPRYSYGQGLFLLTAYDVPICIGCGWGIIFYAATWTAQRLRLKSVLLSSLIAGVLGVNVDLSLDPIAHQHGFWTWKPPTPPFSEASTLFGVPFDNFVAWVVLIGVYGFIVRKAFHWVNRRVYKQPGAPGGAALAGGSGRFLLLDLLVPPLAAATAGLGFVLIRRHADSLYALVGRLNAPVGEAIVFSSLFLLGTIVFWHHVLRSSRNEDVNAVVLFIPIYLHVLSLILLLIKVLTSDISTFTPLLVLLPLNLVAGSLAFAWPCLNTLLDRFSGDAEPTQLPPMIQKTLSSYAGHKVRVLVCTPRSEAELRATLEYAKWTGRSVTFRAGGNSFDTQALNEQLVISLQRFDQIGEIQPEGADAFITVGGGATWGKILQKTLPHGFAPYIMVTSSSATAGGTLSSNSLTRFSASCGREGRYVERFKVLTPQGKIWECSRTRHPELFNAAIGGLGYVGAVLEITYRLLQLPAKDAMVKTEFTRVEGLDKLPLGLRGQNKPRFSGLVDCLAQVTQKSTAPVALSAVVNLRGGSWGLVASSEYVAPTTLRKSVFHDPNSIGHLLLQLMGTIPGLRRIGYWITFRVAYRQTRTYVDGAFGYTFFEDGNRRLRRLLHLLGVPSQILQQTFIIPGASKQGTDALSSFLEQADDHLDRNRLEPALIDVLYVAKDNDAFVLSSSNNLDGFAVTFTFERLFRGLDKERDALRQLSVFCTGLGGRVHLVKNVCADPEVIADMYQGAIADMARLREPHGAIDLLHNEFSRRVLPGI